MDERTSEISEGFVILLLMMRNYMSSHQHQRVDSSFSDNDQTKKTSLLFINHSEFLSLIKDSDEDSERAENDTEQLMLLFSQNM